ncbi:MAG: CsgG/HfaB family protein [Elusimicrobiota bacterium]
MTAALMGAPRPACADPYEKLAEGLSRSALDTGYRRVAVLPFQASGGGRVSGGLAISERLVSRMVSRRGLEVVERTLLDQVFKELELGSRGVIDASQTRRVGRVLGVQAIVTGSFFAIGAGLLEVHARLIDAETARILGAATAVVKQEWQDEGLGSNWTWDIQPPRLEEFPIVRLVPDPFQEEPDCAGWEGRVDQLQASTLELRARYWAGRLREPGFRPSELRRNPGSDIRSLSARHGFYKRLKELYDTGYRDALASEENEQLESSDRLAARMTEGCDR